jgi:catechol 2,3-dioxygenase-like lactoylglutathione lyase family enzyme
LAPANRMPVSDLKKFAVAALIVVGVFLLCCGTGMSNVVVGGAGVLLAVGGPLLILFTSARGNAKLYVFGTAHVVEVSPLPAAGTTGRCELELVINARGIDGVPVRIRDAAVPVNKWPDVGATLPVRVVPGNARKVTILWDEVRTHREAAYDDRMYPGFASLSDEERAHAATEEVEFDHGPLPPDDRATVTDLPLIDSDADAEQAAAEQVLVMDRTSAVPAPRSPEATTGGTVRRKPSPRPRGAGRPGRGGSTRGGSTGIGTPPPPPRRPSPAHAAPDDIDDLEEVEVVETSNEFQDIEPTSDEPATDEPEAAKEPEEEPEAAEEPEVIEEPEVVEEAQVVDEPDAVEESEIVEEAQVLEEPRATEEPEILEPETPPRELEAEAANRHEALEEREPDDVYVPNPYVTEIYAPLPEDLTNELRTPRADTEDIAHEPIDPADELEQPQFQEGAVAQFLAATPRRRAVPLAGVNGVSVTLIVSDLQRSRRFYRDTLGLSELDSSPASAVLASGDARVVLRRVADMPPVDRRVVHLNLEVPDVYEAYERLRADGVEFVHRPRVVPQGEQLELCSATFRDPDGHAIALTRWELRR